ncbi:hypothetical protein AC579_5250 [Pseudocercospora musae]|uniref:Zinc finger PHD-type domain-containing protein n=1 Tax=Pseudocercospora musae TaxID=113226 RepID=A0A139IPF9_9PEZI|nr:hypothetical protein AC579_5250 [Pseudocercospora musae]
MLFGDVVRNKCEVVDPHQTTCNTADLSAQSTANPLLSSHNTPPRSKATQSTCRCGDADEDDMMQCDGNGCGEGFHYLCATKTKDVMVYYCPGCDAKQKKSEEKGKA